MDIGNLSQADKHLLYGLLLKKKRPPALDRRILAVMRGAGNLDSKIDAIMALDGQTGSRGQPELKPGPGPAAAGIEQDTPGKKKAGVLIVDVFPQVTRLLKKCGLKRSLSFTRIGASIDAIYLIRKLRVKLIIFNETLAPEEYTRYYEICRTIEPNIKIIYLDSPPRGLRADAPFTGSTRFLEKPLNISRLEASARELLGAFY